MANITIQPAFQNLIRDMFLNASGDAAEIKKIGIFGSIPDTTGTSPNGRWPFDTDVYGLKNIDLAAGTVAGTTQIPTSLVFEIADEVTVSGDTSWPTIEGYKLYLDDLGADLAASYTFDEFLRYTNKGNLTINTVNLKVTRGVI